MAKDSIYAGGQLEQMLCGDISRRIPIRLFTDSEATLESVTSSKQIMTKTLKMVIVDLKERLLNGEITSIAWLLTEKMWADLLTKEMKLPDNLEDILSKNKINLPDTRLNEVRAFGQEVRIQNIRNRRVSEVS